MIISIDSGSIGWSVYVLNGTYKKPRDKSKVKIIDGNLQLGDTLCKNNNFEESYYRIVLAFKGKPKQEVMLDAYKDFKDNFMYGLNHDEFHIDAVMHKDTDDYHIHVRIPKQNLLTNTHLQLYYDKIDRPRKELIQDYISLKYGFEIAREVNQKVFKEDSNLINIWRKDNKQKSFDFSKRKGRTLANNQINEYIKELIENDFISNTTDIKALLEDLDLKVIKFDRDLKKDFAYVTVENDTGKLRIKGEIYDNGFWKLNKKDRTKQIKTNQRDTSITRDDNQRLTEVQAQLIKQNEKRLQRVNQLFKSSRTREQAKHQKLINKCEAKNNNTNSNTINDNRSNGNENTNTSTNTTEISMGSAKANANNTEQNPIHISNKRDNNKRTRSKIYENQGDINDIFRATINRYDNERKKRDAQRIELNQEIISNNTRAKHSTNELTRNFDKTSRAIIQRQFGATFKAIFSRFRAKFDVILQNIKQGTHKRIKLVRDYLTKEVPIKSTYTTTKNQSRKSQRRQ